MSIKLSEHHKNEISVISYHNNLSDDEWDLRVAQVDGHPLQSALWGNAKRTLYDISDERFAFYVNDKLAVLVRVETRGKKPFFACAWIPQGPIFFDALDEDIFYPYLIALLKKKHYALCAISPWKSIRSLNMPAARKTIWINLQLGLKKLWEELDKQWRYGVGRSRRLGVETCIAATKDEVSEFYKLCLTVSKEKKFLFAHSESFLHYLIEHGNAGTICSKLFLAKYNHVVVAGTFILQSGRNIHYLFGAVDRQYPSLRAGELIQWFVMEWACAQGCVLYDLGGIDLMENSSVAAFKKKMGGVVITLPHTQIIAFNAIGKISFPVIKNRVGG